MADPQPIPQTAEGQIQDQSTEATPPTQPLQPSTPSSTETKPEPLLAEEKPAEEPAPDKYADYKLPENFQINQDLLNEANTLFKGLKLSQTNAQKLIDLYVKNQQEASDAPAREWKNLNDSWREESMNHPDLKGKLGPGKEISVRIAKALDGLQDPKLAQDFRQAMDLTGAGNHPAFIRVIAKWASAVTEGSHVAGNGPSPLGQSAPGQAERSAAQTIWPSLPSGNR